MDDGIESHDGFATRQAQRLQFVVNEFEQVVIVACVDFDEHVVAASRVMTLHYLGYLLQFLYYRIEGAGVFQVEAYIGARFVANLLWVDNELRALDNPQIGEFLDALMDSCTTNVALSCYFQKRNTSILSNHLEDLLV